METFAGMASAYLGVALAVAAVCAAAAVGWGVYSAVRGRREMRMWEQRFRALDEQRRRGGWGRR